MFDDFNPRSKSKVSFADEQQGAEMCFGVSAAMIGGSIIGGAIQSDAASSAARTQARAAERASEASLQATRETNALQWQQYQQSLQGMQPYAQAGQSAMSALMGGLGLGPLRAGSTEGGAMPGTGNTYTNAQGQTVDAQGNPVNAGPTQLQQFGATQAELDAAGQTVAPGMFNQRFAPSDLTTDPSYQWRLDQGLKSLQASAAARGGLLTGQGAADINNYAQGAASQEYQSAYNRFMDQQNTQYNRLASLAGVGQTAGSSMGNAAQQAGSNIAGNTMAGVGASNAALMGGANATAAGQVGAGNAWAGALNGAAGNWMTMQYLNGRNPLGSAGGTGMTGPGMTIPSGATLGGRP